MVSFSRLVLQKKSQPSEESQGFEQQPHLSLDTSSPMTGSKRWRNESPYRDHNEEHERCCEHLERTTRPRLRLEDPSRSLLEIDSSTSFTSASMDVAEDVQELGAPWNQIGFFKARASILLQRMRFRSS